MTNTDPADTTTPPGAAAPADAAAQAAPVLLDVVRARHVLEPHRSHPGVVIDIFRQAHMNDGDRYRVEFRGGITEWFWRDQLTVQPWAAERDIVLTDLAAVRTILHHAITTAEGHDVLHSKLGDIFDALTATATSYLGGPVDTLTPATTPTR